MKSLRKTSAVAAMGICMAFTAQTGFAEAESTSSSKSGSQSSLQQEQQEAKTFGSRPQSRQSSQTSTTNVYEASELEGMGVESSDGESLGSVDSVAVDLQAQHPSFIVVESNAILGIGGELRVVPVEAVKIVQSEDLIGTEQVVRVDIDKATWEEIPTHERAEIAELCDPAQTQQIYQHYNVQQQTSEFGARSSSSQSSEKSSSPQPSDKSSSQQEPKVETPEKTPGDGPEFGVRDQAMQDESRPGLSGQSSEPETEFGSTPDREPSKTESSQSSSATEIEQQAKSESEETTDQVFGARNQTQMQSTTSGRTTTTTTQTQSSGKCELVLTTELSGRAIQGARQEQIGSVENVILNVETGQIQYVLVSPEGDLMGGATDVFAIAPQALTTVTDDQIVVSVTQQDLDQAEVLTQSDLSSSQRSSGSQVFLFQRESVTFGSANRNTSDETTGDADSDSDVTDPNASDPSGIVPPPHDPGMEPGDRGIDQTPSGQDNPDREFQGRDRGLEQGPNSADRERERQTPRRPQSDSREFGTPQQDRNLQGRESDTEQTPGAGTNSTGQQDSTRNRGMDSGDSTGQQDSTRNRGMDSGDSSTGGSNSTSGSSTSRPL